MKLGPLVEHGFLRYRARQQVRARRGLAKITARRLGEPESRSRLVKAD